MAQLSPFDRYTRQLLPIRECAPPAFVPVKITPPGSLPTIGHAADPITFTIGKGAMTLSSALPPAWVAPLLDPRACAAAPSNSGWKWIGLRPA